MSEFESYPFFRVVLFIPLILSILNGIYFFNNAVFDIRSRLFSLISFLLGIYIIPALGAGIWAVWRRYDRKNKCRYSIIGGLFHTFAFMLYIAFSFCVGSVDCGKFGWWGFFYANVIVFVISTIFYFICSFLILPKKSRV
ncbi:hypothetical protein [Neisseria dumasiana]|uniref:hypothetical protein n=1 Tax=Neisseria dumasiana TaxID=1931275 RepID=UPI00117F8C3C|nr:hypothetical protein [Neisseria dumasiana]UOO85423.1 hypothetical protein LVJ88_05480 [Neisseria dumasiana]